MTMNHQGGNMTYCTNCGKQNTKRIEDNNGKPYQLEDDLNKWNDKISVEKNIILYTTFVCNDCGNLFALGETSSENN